MKKVLFLLCVALALFPYNITADAYENKYSQVLTGDVILYLDASLTIPWFTLPYSYYVKVLSISGTGAKVEYKGDGVRPSAKGYIKVENLNLQNNVPDVLYPNLVLSVNQNCLLFKDTDFSLTETLTQGATVDFYGILTRANGDEFIYGYVSTNTGDKFVGYIPVSAVYEFSVPTLKMEQEKTSESREEESKGEESTEEVNKTANTLQIVIIIAISIIAVSIVYLLFRPSSQKAKDEVIISSELDDE